MYLPETNAQMFDILTELRIYAAMNGMPQLAEKLDDALMLLLAEGRNPTRPPRAGPAPARSRSSSRAEPASPRLDLRPRRAGHAAGR